jgi:hypothetical protein
VPIFMLEIEQPFHHCIPRENNADSVVDVNTEWNILGDPCFTSRNAAGGGGANSTKLSYFPAAVVWH